MTDTTDVAEDLADQPTTETTAAEPRGPETDAPAGAEAGAADAAALDDRPTFADLGVQAPIVEALAAAGIVHPFPIQSMTLPVALGGHDIIGQAKTGTGKTLGFGIPTLHSVVGPGEHGFDDLAEPGRPQALAVAPTRELAVQVARDIERAAGKRTARVLTVYGGRAYEPQVEALARGVEIVVGTPGRLLDLVQQGYLVLSQARVVVLDEADEMLDLGFLPDVEKLLSHTPAGRQTMLFSATMPGPVVALARRYMTQPTHIRAADDGDDSATVKNITQVVYRAHAMDKVEVLARLMQARGRGLSIVFARTKRTAAKVADDLASRGFAAAPLHGDLGQGAREQALRAFRAGKVDILVATDVASRGIDVTDVTHVVNYQCPEDEKTYLHRTGRTGRAGASGTAVTFVDWDDLHRWAMIDRALDLGMPQPVETYSTSPHLFTDLDIPEGTTGRLPRSQRTREGLDAEEVEDLGETGRRGEHDAGRGGGRGDRSGGGRGEGRSGGRRDGSRREGSRQEGSGRDGSRREGSRRSEAAPTRQVRRPVTSEDPIELPTSGRGTSDLGTSGQATSSQGTASQPTTDRTSSGQATDGSAEASSTPRRRRRRGGRGRSGGGSTPATGSGAAD